MKKKPTSQGDLFSPAAPPKVEAAVAPAEVAVPAWRKSAGEPRVLTVGELTRQIKGTLEQNFGRVLVRGEVSGYRGPNARGHLYFSLKDAEATLDARIWASMASRLKFKLQEGMAVVAEGSLDLYAPQGRYSLIVSRLEPEGVGALALAFEQLKKRLTQEGLIGAGRVRPRRPLPFLPRRIGVVTSLSGAALRDFLRVLHNRHPHLSVLICDARVQGEGSANEVVSAIERLGRTDIDVLVVTRGGGSIEDLWTFNEEAVARAIFASPVPVVSAIGHEVDFTIADFVADFRAPTPSAAAERLAPVLRELEIRLGTHATRLSKAVERVVLEHQRKLSFWSVRLGDPRRLLTQQRLHLSQLSDELGQNIQRHLRQRSQRHRELSGRLHLARPQAQLARLKEALAAHRAQMVDTLRLQLLEARQRFQHAHRGLFQHLPAHRLRQESIRLDALKNRLRSAGEAEMKRQRNRLLTQVGTLHALSPLSAMTRGFSLTFRNDGQLLRRASEVALGEIISVKLAPRAIEHLEDADVLEAKVVSRHSGA